MWNVVLVHFTYQSLKEEQYPYREQETKKLVLEQVTAEVS